jgi:hypothetical protein
MIESNYVDSIHESSHVILGRCAGVYCDYATIKKPAHVRVNWRSILTMIIFDNRRAIFFLAGTVGQAYWFPSIDSFNRRDEEILRGLSDRRRKEYTAYILKKLEDPTVKQDIEMLAYLLMREGTIVF